MTISDPILRRKLNQLQQDFGLAMSFESSATRMRMRPEDQNVGAYLVFEVECQKKFFRGFDWDGRSIPGLYQTVQGYFQDFPRNLHDSISHELAEWLDLGTRATLNGARSRLNQLQSGEQSARRNETFSLLERDIRFIRESESQRLFTALAEIRQRREYEVQQLPEPSKYDRLAGWFKARWWAVWLFVLGTVSLYLFEHLDALSKLLCWVFKYKCGT